MTSVNPMENEPKLTATNYSAWTRTAHIRYAQIFGDIAEVLVNPAITRPILETVDEAAGANGTAARAANAVAREEFLNHKKNQPRLIGMVLTSMTDDFRARVTTNEKFMHIEDEPSASKDIVNLMKVIREECGTANTRSPAAYLLLEERFTNSMMKAGDSMDAHIVKMRDLFADAEASGVMNHDNPTKVTKFLQSIKIAVPKVFSRIMHGDIPADLTGIYAKARHIAQIEAVLNPVKETARPAMEAKGNDKQKAGAEFNSCSWCTDMLGFSNVKHSMIRKVDGKKIPHCRRFKDFLKSKDVNLDDAKPVEQARVGVEDVETAYTMFKYGSAYSTLFLQTLLLLYTILLMMFPILPTLERTIVCFTGQLALAYSSSNTQEGIFLDSCCSSHWFKDANLFEYMEPCSISIRGIGGSVNATHRGKTRFGMAYYGNAEMNLLSTNQIHRDNQNHKTAGQIVVDYNSTRNTFTVSGKAIPLITFTEHPTLRIPHANIQDKMTYTRSNSTPIAMATSSKPIAMATSSTNDIIHPHGSDAVATIPAMPN